VQRPGDVEEGLIDGDALHVRCEIAEDVDHGIAEPLIFGEVPTDEGEVRAKPLRPPAGHAATDAEPLRLVRRCQHHSPADRDRPTAKGRIEHLLHRRVERVEVGVEDSGAAGHRCSLIERLFASPEALHTEAMLHVPMVARDAEDQHRVSTPLELFFDLTFVVAVAQAGAALHDALAQGRFAHALAVYPMVFFGVWWAWMNFTWFASAYDTDDVLYRLMVFVQMAGVLILAAGVPRAFEHSDFGVMTAGYVVMRLAMVSQWVRAARTDLPRRQCASRYAIGIAIVQVGWVARLALHGAWGTVGFGVLVVAEVLIPVWAEAVARTTWHPQHVAERYGLFTIIVLGESILPATMGVQRAIDADHGVGDLVTTCIGGMLTLLAMWWIYFAMPRERATEALRGSFESDRSGAFGWGYGHYAVFAAVAATGVGLALEVDQATGNTRIGDHQAAAALTIPVAIYLLVVWLLHRRHKDASHPQWLTPLTAAAIVATTFTPEPVLLTGVLISVLLGWAIVVESRHEFSSELEAGRSLPS
jgi:low temperature requirement protein LtrA